MKVKTLSALAGIGTAMILSGQANAAFTGLQLVDVTSWMANSHPNANVRASFTGAGGGSNFSVYRLFATFSGTTADDRINAVFGELPSSTFSLTMASGSIHNQIDGTGTYSDPFVHYNVPTSSFAGVLGGQRGWDTFATIGWQGGPGGIAPSWGPGGADNDIFNNFTGSFSTNDAAYFIQPDNVQGQAVALAGLGGSGNGVMLFQLTVTNTALAAPSLFSGVLNLNVDGVNTYGLTFNNIPAPGALALLGLAGLVGARRRRA